MGNCAPLIVFLASDDAGYLTGQSFMVDGGIRQGPSDFDSLLAGINALCTHPGIWAENL